MKKIKLGLYGIELTTSIADSEASGEITCDPYYYETCPSCGQRDCNFQCDGVQMDKTQTEEVVRGRLQSNAAIDGVLSMILAHACSDGIKGKVDIESPAYIEGVETALDAITNNV